ncbi:hypothetical protein EC957_007572 [Mortierella hygrophila]|uniref:Senescence domain-containing protein n=1 Tax=Mortierella hygrophila TaxID=979708 RepID=A0A9P6JYC4_9FUNG|nr:hypothetical protein EC957_007572 [Mortierella hygrophila]
MSEQQPPAADNTPAAMIQVVLTIPNTAITQLSSAIAKKKFIGTGKLKVYSTSTIPSKGPSSSSTSAGTEATNGHHHTTFMTLETNDTPTGSYKSLVTHPLMPSSKAQKTGEYTWRFSVPGNGYLEVHVPENSQASDIAALENLLADRIVYTNQYKLRHQLAIVDDVGQIYGVLDKVDVKVMDDNNVSLSENAKSPVVVEAIEEPDKSDGTLLRLKISVPSADDMADYLTSASQYFGESMIKGATVVAEGITTSSTYLNSKIPERQVPLTISPFIKNRIRNLTSVSKGTFGATSDLKSTVIMGALSSGYRVIKHWTAKDDPESYSTMQNMAYSILNSAGILIQAAEESIDIITAPAISATQDLAERALGPDARELVTEALGVGKNFTLVYFDGAGVSRRAFLHTSRIAALKTAQEVKEGKLKMKERKKNAEEHVQKSLDISVPASVQAAAASAQTAAASAGAAATHAKELIFSYFGRGEDAHGKNGIDGIRGCFSLGDVSESNRGRFGQTHLSVEDILSRLVRLSCEVACEISDRAGDCNYSVLPYVFSVILDCHESEGIQREREVGQSGQDPSQFLLCETVVVVESKSLVLNAQKWMDGVVHFLREVKVGHADEFLSRIELDFEEVLLEDNGCVDNEEWFCGGRSS